MKQYEEAVLLRIFLGESDRHDGQPLYEAIVLKAREMGIAGATVLRGPMGYGRSSRLHTTKLLRLSEDLPVVVDIVDAPGRIDRLVDALEPIMGSGLITLERVRVVRYGEGDALREPDDQGERDPRGDPDGGGGP